MFQQINELPGLYIANTLTECVSEFSGFASFRRMRSITTITRIQAVLLCPERVTFNINIENRNLELYACHFMIAERSSRFIDKKVEAHCRQQVREYVSPVLAELPAMDARRMRRTRAKLLSTLLSTALNRSSNLKQHMIESFPVWSANVKVLEFRPEDGDNQDWSCVSCHWIGRRNSIYFHRNSVGVFQPTRFIAQWSEGKRLEAPDEYTLMLVQESVEKFYTEVLDKHIENNSKIRS